MKDSPIAFRVALLFMLLNATTWFAFGILTISGMIPMPGDFPAIKWILSTLAFIGSVVLLVLCWLLTLRSRFGYFLSLIALLVLIALTLTDQVGLADLLYLVVALVPFVLLVLLRNWYFQKAR